MVVKKNQISPQILTQPEEMPKLLILDVMTKVRTIIYSLCMREFSIVTISSNILRKEVAQDIPKSYKQ
jgi:hypothetical protein